jgi:hypothetical protein
MGLKSPRKGSRIERELVQLHRGAGIPAERVPLSGAAGGTFSGDLRVAGGMRAEVKARASGEGFRVLERWLGEMDLLFLRRDRSKPLVVMPWTVYEQLMDRRPAATPPRIEPEPEMLNELSLPEFDDLTDPDAQTLLTL